MTIKHIKSFSIEQQTAHKDTYTMYYLKLLPTQKRYAQSVYNNLCHAILTNFPNITLYENEGETLENLNQLSAELYVADIGLDDLFKSNRKISHSRSLPRCLKLDSYEIILASINVNFLYAFIKKVL
jgi:hypothetical protein